MNIDDLLNQAHVRTSPLDPHSGSAATTIAAELGALVDMYVYPPSITVVDSNIIFLVRGGPVRSDLDRGWQTKQLAILYRDTSVNPSWPGTIHDVQVGNQPALVKLCPLDGGTASI